MIGRFVRAFIPLLLATTVRADPPSDAGATLVPHVLLSTDFRSFLNDHAPTSDRDSFALRFAGMRLEASLARDYRAQLFFNLAGNRVTIIEAWVEAQLTPWLRLRAGSFLFPITEERLTPVTALPFVSTSLSAMLLPAQDIGLQLLGDYGPVAYNLAVVNGSVAGGLSGGDGDSAKDVVARVFAHPFEATELVPLRALGVGLGASLGTHTGTATAPQLPTLASYGGLPVFAYRAGSMAGGRIERLAPHLTWSLGPVALYADAVWTRERVIAPMADRARGSVATHALSAIATVLLTGEDAAPLAFVTPRRPFDPGRGQLGAIELVVGAGTLSIDDAAFPVLADPATAMRGFRVVGGGVNWFLTRGVAVLTSYGHQLFRAAAGGVRRPDEDTVVARLQLVL